MRRVKQYLAGVAALPLATIDRGGFFRKTGWARTMRTGRAVDSAGKPIPWWSYSLIAFLDERLKPDMRVFEYGSGGSTAWLASRVKEIISNETSRAWYLEQTANGLPRNVVLRHVPYKAGDELWRTIEDLGLFDLVIVDDFDRARSAENAPKFLTARGVVLVDDATEHFLQPGIGALHAAGFRQLSFHDLGPCSTVVHCTAIFYRDGNCLGL